MGPKQLGQKTTEGGYEHPFEHFDYLKPQIDRIDPSYR